MKKRFRLGTTSYIIPDDILPNVKFLGPSMDDIELLLFEVDDDNNLPDQTVINQLIELANLHTLSYTVHLPLDLKLASNDDHIRAASIEKASRAINATRPLNPWAYVVHLESDDNPSPHDTIATTRWQEQSIRSLEELAIVTGDFEQLAVENIECYDEEILIPVIETLPTSICIDVGHFIKVGKHPIHFVKKFLDRTRVIHVHGVSNGRDHRGLDLVEPTLIKDLVDTLLEHNYPGVLTIEVFSEKHLNNSVGLITSLLPDNDPEEEQINVECRMNNKLTLILGGARSGKSSFAEKMAANIGDQVLYVATAQVKDSEMHARIRSHRQARPGAWKTLEAPLNLGQAIPVALENYPAEVVLVDCLTLFVSNCILDNLSEHPTDEELDNIDEIKARERLTAELDSLLQVINNRTVPWILVSNELGLGLVPPYHLGRIYRDLLGWANQRLAAAADQVFLMIAGLPLDIKALSLDNVGSE